MLLWHKGEEGWLVMAIIPRTDDDLIYVTVKLLNLWMIHPNFIKGSIIVYDWQTFDSPLLVSWTLVKGER